MKFSLRSHEYATSFCLYLTHLILLICRTQQLTPVHSPAREVLRMNVYFIHREIFTTKSLVSNPVHSCLQPVKSEKLKFHAWRKRFVQSRRTRQKYWVFAPSNSPLSAPSVYLKLSFVVGCVNILKGVWSSVAKFIS